MKLFKFIKTLTELVGILAIVFAIDSGADPTLSVLLIGAIIIGVEAVESLVVHSGEGERERGDTE